MIDGPFDLTLTDSRHPFHVQHIEMALEEASLAADEDEVPVGCVIVHDGIVVGRGHNQVERLQDATAQAVNILQSDCPTYRPLTVTARVEVMEQRLDAMLRAVELVQPALARFYGSLNDEQKERFNRLSPTQG